MADYKDAYDFSDYDPGRGPRRRPEETQPENDISDYEKGRRDGYAQGREEAIAETLLTIIKAVYNGGK